MPQTRSYPALIQPQEAPSNISLPASKFTTATSHRRVNFESPQLSPLAQIGAEVANEAIIKSREYKYAASSIEGQSETVSEIFNKGKLRKIVPKAAMKSIVESREPEFANRNAGGNNLLRLVSQDDQESEVPRYVSVRRVFRWISEGLSIFSKDFDPTKSSGKPFSF